MKILSVVLYLLFAPIVGGLLSGVDRKISARMQRRFGPPLLQPFYDVFKLFQKERVAVNSVQTFFVFCFAIFIVFTGILFFMGGDILLVIFALTLASIFLIMGAYSTNSPYSSLGADRELMQMMAYEPMVFLTAIGFYLVTDSFSVNQIIAFDKPLILYLPGVFFGFLYILTIKLRKSPFDLSASHHAHQELVSGLTTEFSGSTLAIVEIAHWYENVFLLGIVALFFWYSAPWSPILAVSVTLLVYFLEILIDNTYARVKWSLMLGSAWLVAAVFGSLNLLILYMI